MKRLLIVAVLLGFGLNASHLLAKDDASGPRAIIKMADGEKIVIKFYPKDAPKSVANFIKLAKKGFYDGLTFHRVVPGFVAQGGDPAGNGSGGPGYTIKGEFSENGVDNPQTHVKGAVAMARTNEPDSAGSQFYICLDAQPSLDGKYAVFGQVIEGMDEVMKIQVGDKMEKVTIVGGASKKKAAAPMADSTPVTADATPVTADVTPTDSGK
jgi:cyclophilin family peptidyl-prolyl cis-trans isomerase